RLRRRNHEPRGGGAGHGGVVDLRGPARRGGRAPCAGGPPPLPERPGRDQDRAQASGPDRRARQTRSAEPTRAGAALDLAAPTVTGNWEPGAASQPSSEGALDGVLPLALALGRKLVGIRRLTHEAPEPDR